MQRCVGPCKALRPDSFFQSKTGKRLVKTCRKCRGYNKKQYAPVEGERKNAKKQTTKEYRRARSLRINYNLTPEQFATLLEQQDGACAICNKVPHSTLHVDHCHTTGKVRGLLCSTCNTGLGMLGDSADSLEKALQYLKNK